jgi:hypothetical protein
VCVGKEEEKALIEVEAATQMGAFLAAWVRGEWHTLLELVVHRRDINTLFSAPRLLFSTTSTTTSTTPTTPTSPLSNDEHITTTAACSSTPLSQDDINKPTSSPFVTDTVLVNRFIEALFRLLVLRLFIDQLEAFFLRTFRACTTSPHFTSSHLISFHFTSSLFLFHIRNVRKVK